MLYDVVVKNRPEVLALKGSCELSKARQIGHAQFHDIVLVLRTSACIPYIERFSWHNHTPLNLELSLMAMPTFCKEKSLAFFY